jgi:predicted Zn-dependent protease with MMP-like domain
MPPSRDPMPFAAALDEVAIVIADEPTGDQLASNELPDDEGLYGLYEGVPRTEWGADWVTMPNRITLFRLPLEADFADPDDLADEVWITVVRSPTTGIDDERLHSSASTERGAGRRGRRHQRSPREAPGGGHQPPSRLSPVAARQDDRDPLTIASTGSTGQHRGQGRRSGRLRTCFSRSARTASRQDGRVVVRRCPRDGAGPSPGSHARERKPERRRHWSAGS